MHGREVLESRRGSVAVLSLNRPDRLNAWTDSLRKELFDALQRCDADAEIRAIVVTGAGRGFCAYEQKWKSEKVENKCD